MSGGIESGVEAVRGAVGVLHGNNDLGGGDGGRGDEQLGGVDEGDGRGVAVHGYGCGRDEAAAAKDDLQAAEGASSGWAKAADGKWGLGQGEDRNAVGLGKVEAGAGAIYGEVVDGF